MGNKAHPPTNLKKLRNWKGWTQAETAEKFGLSEAGYIKIEDSDRGLKGDRIALAAKIFSVRTQDIMDMSFDPAAAKDAPLSGAVPADRSFTFKKVVGIVAAGIFRDVELFDDDLEEMISAPPNTRYPWARQKVWRVEGDSMNQAKPKPINDGDYVVGVVYEDIQEAVKLKTGMNVVVKRTQNSGQTFEVTVKELCMFEDRTEFLARSSNPKYRPIIVKRDLTADDGTIVEIEAIVQYVFDSHEAQF